ncbi:vomeronasal type-2 receptor 26-like [Macrotis lagotis]|uniref:vomeronasal type-2 receptor 26-like n=1 Tax=Macrotis lagotis TaxID=92651 RepID=UPI003D697996
MGLDNLRVSLARLCVILLLPPVHFEYQMGKSLRPIERAYNPTYRKEGDLILVGFFSLLKKTEDKVQKEDFKYFPMMIYPNIEMALAKRKSAKARSGAMPWKSPLFCGLIRTLGHAARTKLPTQEMKRERTDLKGRCPRGGSSRTAALLGRRRREITDATEARVAVPSCPRPDPATLGAALRPRMRTNENRGRRADARESWSLRSSPEELPARPATAFPPGAGAVVSNFQKNQLDVESSIIWMAGEGLIILNYDCSEQSNSVAVIGGMTSTQSISLATILNLYKIPQVYAASCSSVLSFCIMISQVISDGDSDAHGGEMIFPSNTVGEYLGCSTTSNNHLAVEISTMQMAGQGSVILHSHCGDQANAVAVIGGKAARLATSMATIQKLYKIPQVCWYCYTVVHVATSKLNFEDEIFGIHRQIENHKANHDGNYLKEGIEIINPCLGFRNGSCYDYRNTSRYLAFPENERRGLGIWLLYENYQPFFAFQFAVNEINKNPHLLSNITLGYQVVSNFQNNQLDVESSIIWMAGKGPIILNYDCSEQSNSVAVIGGMTSTQSISMATILNLYKVPQINYGPFDLLLTDKLQYPYVYQMGSKNSTLHLAFVQMMLHFGWTWIGLILSDTVRGESFFKDLQAEMARNSLCVGFMEIISSTFDLYLGEKYSILSRTIPSSSNVIFTYGDSDFLKHLFVTLVDYILYGKVLVTTLSWGFFSDQQLEEVNNLHGTIILSPPQREIPGFIDFVESLNQSVMSENIFLTAFWEAVFAFKFSENNYLDKFIPVCQEGLSLADVQAPDFNLILRELSLNVYSAVYVVAYALHELFQFEVRETSELSKSPDLSYKLHHFLKWKFPVSSASDELCGDPVTKDVETYEILNFKSFPNDMVTLVKVGEFIPHGQGFSLNQESIEWPRGQTPIAMCTPSCGPGFKKTIRESEPICCFDCDPCPEGHISNQTDAEQCLQCPEEQYPSKDKDRCLDKTVTFLAYAEPLGMTLAWAALCFSLLTALLLGVFVKHRDTPIVKANNRSLSYILLISLILCFLCSLLFIGHPNSATCLLRQTTFAVVFTVAIASILAKTLTVVLAFRATQPRSTLQRWVTPKGSYSLIVICSLTQICFCVIWIGTYPPFSEMDYHSEPDFIIIQCNEGSILAFYCVLGYMALLALGSFTLAFLARNLPDTFNEAKFLTFSMLVFCSVWISFLPTYQSTKGKAMVSVEIFSILASSAGILAFIFAPKCYVILLRPDRNAPERLKIKFIFPEKSILF